MNTQFKKGLIKFCVLLILEDEVCYGYDLVSKISSFVDISEGTIYPLLKKLRSECLVESYLVESKDGPARKYYRLTASGQGELAQLHREWQSLVAGIEGMILKYGGSDE